jgi:hypothetical protein
MNEPQVARQRLDELEKALRGYIENREFLKYFADYLLGFRRQLTCSPSTADSNALLKAWDQVKQRTSYLPNPGSGHKDLAFAEQIRGQLQAINPIVASLVSRSGEDFRSQFIWPRRVFISYSRHDEDAAERIRGRLGAEDFEPWWDQTDIRGGKEWRDEIQQGIKQSVAMVVLVTAHSVESQFVFYEWAFARGAGVRVIPIWLEDVPLWEPLKDIQGLKFHSGKDEWSKLRSALENCVKETSGGS